jgi:hypothetical protein
VIGNRIVITTISRVAISIKYAAYNHGWLVYRENQPQNKLFLIKKYRYYLI